METLCASTKADLSAFKQSNLLKFDCFSNHCNELGEIIYIISPTYFHYNESKVGGVLMIFSDIRVKDINGVLHYISMCHVNKTPLTTSIAKAITTA